MSIRRTLLAVLPIFAIGACTASLSEQDRATLTAASQNAEQAKQQAAQALAAAQAAQATAQQADADAKAAEQKANQMYQRSLHK